MLVTEQIVTVSDIWSGPLTDVANAKKVGVGGTYGLCVMPDASIVYTSVHSGQLSKAWIMNADGTQQKQLTTGSSNDGGFVTSPDGRYIVFSSSRTGHFEIWRMNPDGGALLQLTDIKGAGAPSVTPDGDWVIYLTKSDGYLYKVPIEGGEPRRVAGKAMGVSAVSPDGKLIAYIAPGKDAWGIAVSSFKDGSAVRKFEPASNSLNNNSLKWTPDGKALLYSLSTGGVTNIWMQPLDGGPPRQVTDFKAEGIFRFDISADGKTLVCARGGWKSDIVLIKNLR
jgi:Tol biopolymer transport system component